MKPILTIIVPVYNLENYIGDALESIYTQDLDENMFEVIVINDGSTDLSYEKVLAYSQCHSNLKVLTQDNQGVSVARNNALGYVSGEYVTFLDGDDSFVQMSLKSILQLIQTYDSFDILYSLSIKSDNETETIHNIPSNVSKGVIYSILDVPYFCNNGTVWGGVYNYNFLFNSGVSFIEGIKNSEDLIFNYQLYCHYPRIIFTDIVLNKITIRNGSASRSVSIDRARNYVNNINSILSELSSQSLNSVQVELMHAAMYHCISQAVHMYIECGIDNHLLVYKELNLKDTPSLRTRFLTLSQRIMVILLNNMFVLYFNLIKLKKVLNVRV